MCNNLKPEVHYFGLENDDSRPELNNERGTMLTCLHCGGQIKAWDKTTMFVQKSTGLERVEGGSVQLVPRLDRPGCDIEVTCPGCRRPKE